jgi:hypothetical protein
MAGKGFCLTWTPTTVGGTKTQSMTAWPQLVNGSLRLNHIFIKALAADTQFNFKITSPSGNIVFHRENINSELSEAPDIILRGLYSLTIEKVTTGEGTQKDDTFAGEFMMKDEKDK